MKHQLQVLLLFGTSGEHKGCVVNFATGQTMCSGQNSFDQNTELQVWGPDKSSQPCQASAESTSERSSSRPVPAAQESVGHCATRGPWTAALDINDVLLEVLVRRTNALIWKAAPVDMVAG